MRQPRRQQREQPSGSALREAVDHGRQQAQGEAGEDGGNYASDARVALRWSTRGNKRTIGGTPPMERTAIDGPLASMPVVSRHGVFFWLFSTLVSVRFTFPLVALLTAAGAGRSVAGVLIWLWMVFFGVLVHELGHVFAARYYGHRPKVELYTLGGLTTWTSEREPGWVERLVTSLAGPAIGFVLAACVWAILHWTGPVIGLPLVALALGDFMWISVGWGLINLVPILPLDGGQALEAVLGAAGVARPQHVTRVVSLVAGGTVVVVAFAWNLMWAALLAGLLAYNNAQRLRGLQGVRVVG
jgi:Zn-dependent protease